MGTKAGYRKFILYSVIRHSSFVIHNSTLVILHLITF